MSNVNKEIRRALYGKLAGDGTLTGLLHSPPTGYGQNIFYQLAPSAADPPFVVFNKQAGTPTYSMASGTSAYDSELWLIKGVDRNKTADLVDAISSRLDVLLTDGSLTISGANLMYLVRESDVDYEETASGSEYRHSGALFRLIHD